jgi:hypothetical protein
MGEGGRKRRMEEGVNSSMIYLIFCKNFCKCHNVPLPSTIKKIKIKNKSTCTPHKKKQTTKQTSTAEKKKKALGLYASEATRSHPLRRSSASSVREAESSIR